MPRAITNVTYDFTGTVVLITGGARGQGRSHALGFAAAGADVALLDIAEPDLPTVPYRTATREDLEATAAEVRALGARCLPLVCDVRDAARVEACVEEVVAEFGQVDVLVNNAGTESIHPIHEMPEEAWDGVLDTHLKGSFLTTRSVSRRMIDAGRGGKIVTIGSTNSLIGTPSQAHYTAAKHGAIGFTKAIAVDLAPHGIRCNAVCPGGIDTPMTTGLMTSVHGEWLAGISDLTGPWNLFDPTQMLEPEEITRAVMWLASDAADFVTGQAIVVDAGFSIK